jgi:hypothetical protein
MKTVEFECRKSKQTDQDGTVRMIESWYANGVYWPKATVEYYKKLNPIVDEMQNLEDKITAINEAGKANATKAIDILIEELEYEHTSN